MLLLTETRPLLSAEDDLSRDYSGADCVQSAPECVSGKEIPGGGNGPGDGSRRGKTNAVCPAKNGAEEASGCSCFPGKMQ